MIKKVARDQEGGVSANRELLIVAAHHEHSESLGRGGAFAGVALHSQPALQCVGAKVLAHHKARHPVWRQPCEPGEQELVQILLANRIGGLDQISS
jgi:hypothetical protein